MKKIFLLTGTVIICSLATNAQFRVGVKLGSNLSNQSRNDVNSSKLISNQAFKGYHIGLIGDIPISKNIYLQPQLLYAKKGDRYTGPFGTDAKLTMHNLEMPLNILYKFDLPIGRVFAGAGPVLSYGFAGRLQNNGQTKKLYSGDMKHWNRLEISANALAGFEFRNGFYTSLSYQHGFKDMNKSNDVQVKNRSVSLSVGYLIDWKKIRA